MVKLVNKVMGKEGIYKAYITICGKSKPKTFFPQHWSREKVIKKIMEAYEQSIASNVNPILQSDRKYELIGLTQEGIEIKIFITQNRQITSAYPLM